MNTSFGLLGAHISGEPISAPDIATAETGAVVVFDGIVRNHDGGRGGVELLRYTAHPTAESEISRVAQEVIAAHPNTRLWCAHRTGDLRVGEAAFVVIAAAAHRGDAFAAAEECANRVKAEVPIWKEQRYADGFSNWVGLE